MAAETSLFTDCFFSSFAKTRGVKDCKDRVIVRFRGEQLNVYGPSSSDIRSGRTKPASLRLDMIQMPKFDARLHRVNCR